MTCRNILKELCRTVLTQDYQVHPEIVYLFTSGLWHWHDAYMCIYKLQLKAGVDQSVQRLAEDWTSGVLFPAKARNVLLHSAQTGSGAHPTSYAMDIHGSFLVSKAVGEWRTALLSNAEVKNVGDVPFFHSVLCLYGAVLNYRSTGTTSLLHFSFISLK